MSRMKSLKLAHGLPAPIAGTKLAGEYMVLIVKNDTSYVPGEYLDKDEVTYLCGMNGWDVTIVPYKDD